MSVFIHAHQLLKNVFGDEFAAELACNNRSTKVTYKLVFKVFFNEESVDLSK